MTTPPGSILVVEDDEADLFLLRRALTDAGVSNPLRIAHDGKECVDFLASLRPPAEMAAASAPRLVLLDLKMPRLSGIDVLRWLRDQPVLRSIPVVVLSSSANQRDIEQAYALGANAFVPKPSSIEQRAAFARSVKEFWLGFNHPPLVCTENFAAAQKLHAAAGLGSGQL
jgi:CheY-like chemotaxis protein